MMSKQPNDAPQASSSANSIYTINEDLSVTIDMVAGDQKPANISGVFGLENKILVVIGFFF